MLLSFAFSFFVVVSSMLSKYSLALSRLERKIPQIPQLGAMKLSHAQSTIEELRNLYMIEEQIEIDDRLKDIVEKNAANFGSFIESRRLMIHPTSDKAFQEAEIFVDRFYSSGPGKSREKLVILDSGCGQGLSTVTLSEKYPNIPCIGIDRSISKLSNNRHFSSKDKAENMIDKTPNMLLVQGELTDFWQLVAFKSDWKIIKHFIIHPNPSPKHKNIKQRFYGMFFSSNCFRSVFFPALTNINFSNSNKAHSIFPIIPLLGGELFLRSNWRTYAVEFLEALKVLQSLDAYRSVIPDISSLEVSDFDQTQIFSHFDRKYVKVGIPMFDLSVNFSSSEKQKRIEFWNSLKVPQSSDR